jgi:hypothetical protein
MDKKDIKKVVLAYSGGLDTSIIIPWLKENYNDPEIIAVAGNVGQADELEGLEEKAIKTGASKLIVADLTDEMVEEVIIPSVKMGAKYETYMLGTAFARPVIGKALAEIALEEGADAKRIENEIKTMPNYFADYDTTVNFISLEELKANHSGIPHGGSVIHTGNTGLNGENTHVIEYSLKLDSNPEFTASVLVAGARAIYKLYNRKDYGCKTMFDLAPSDLSPKNPEQLRAELL